MLERLWQWVVHLFDSYINFNSLPISQMFANAKEETADLRRVHRLVHMYDAATIRHPFTEWVLLQRRSLSMKDFCNLFCSQNEASYLSVMSNSKCIWVNDHAFVRYYSKYTESSRFNIETQNMDRSLPPILQRISYVLILKRNDDEEYYFHIHALNHDAADACIQFLLSLEDTYFSNLMVSRRHLQYYSSPAGADQQSKHRFDAFYNLELSCEQQRTIVALSKRILLCHCRFRDGGAVVLEELRGTSGTDFVPFDLYLEGDCPFDNNHWEVFLTLLSEERRLVNKMDLRGFTPRASCRTSELAFARVGDLIFRENLDDSFSFKIIRSVLCGRSPDSLDFKGFDNLDSWHGFGRALASSECQLKRLKLYDFDAERDQATFDESTVAAELADILCHALTQNNSLVELAVDFSVTMTREDFWRVLQCVGNHTTLRTVTFGDCDAWSGVDRKVLTEVWVDILTRNRTIHYVHFDDELYDEQVFTGYVHPQLMRNKYLTLIRRSQQMQDVLSRAYFIGRWIEEAAEELSSPQITFMLLRMNTDVISSYRGSQYKLM